MTDKSIICGQCEHKNQPLSKSMDRRLEIQVKALKAKYKIALEAVGEISIKKVFGCECQDIARDALNRIGEVE